MAKQVSAAKKEEKLSWQMKLWREVKGYAEAIIIALIITTFLFTTVGVAGSSMSPTFYGGNGTIINSLLTGDRLFVPKYETWLHRMGLLGDYRRGDVIIFREPADSPYVGTRRDFLVKRLIGLPGDRIRIEEGQVYINDVALDQSFITDIGGHLGNSNLNEITIPDKQYFFMGDNRMNSVDSRIYGPVDFISIAGKASAIIWPPMRHGSLNWKAVRPPEAFKAIPDN
ncbi:MAG: signal peptidase I [Trueperaceae bacterium]|nr:signal peptidase I [Trueperaceae bacterium]